MSISHCLAHLICVIQNKCGIHEIQVSPLNVIFLNLSQKCIGLWCYYCAGIHCTQVIPACRMRSWPLQGLCNKHSAIYGCRYYSLHLGAQPLAPIKLFTISWCSIVWCCKNHLWWQDIFTRDIFGTIVPDLHPCQDHICQ